ncbi:DNA segregation ATPase FtsK/SpoIIIE or related protein [Cupriavidus necator]|uniref:DNA segregation ATPase ftsk/spoIIIE proteins n=1 Tax=Cupriavidus necator (strain ATCC 17699 / DSM 428 / KCTC 22496 / NCIMB 10442 / H16 / Stanier 337) TaxID=381666 RepID=Q0KDL9_CUPNH|nr:MULTISPECIES: DNA translocase FtsK [Cupriavidus]KUE89402.1 cell division protein FtsK [Cupriavidus necator]QCB99831.1 DNA translocase FtsK [Cupriavidus necator H16]QQB77353.1 DNA translocase FtsK 4TM domain-containing protein [Cupriavidus necator]WKA41673.1 DNA translocase FtsK 4TM domain-containing protein [Cupriavidus necator]CAJ91902.1 DNA segregation ATPase ftsk/spoIIIE proteins [Cupriavidus necator H16]
MARATTTTRTDPSALPSRIGKLLGEVRWFLLLAVTLGFLCVLASYSKTDPGWSHANQVADIHNLGGRVGAWVADVLFFIFGFSAYWLAVLLVRRCWRGWRTLTAELPERADPGLHRQGVTVSWIGFGLTLFSSMGLEAIRMYPLRAALPRAPGGVLGDLLGGWLQVALGFTGATLLLLLLLAIGLSLFFHFSWLTVAEHVGGFVETLFLGFKARRESKQDRIIGEAAKTERKETVEVQRVRIEEAAPVQIVRPQAVPKHERVEREKQQPLFADIQDSDLPPLSLLDPIPPHQETVSAETLEFTSRLIEKKLKDFGVEVKVVAAYPGPVITRYEIEPATGVKGSQVVNLARDLARSLSLVSIRVVETIPGKNYMGLELPNPKRQTVRLSEILGSQVYNESSSSLTMALGKDIAGKPMVADLARMPHCMVAGTTGSGKSVGINAMILSLLYKAKAESVRLILIDPKMLEMSVYEGIPHLLCPVVTDMRQAGNALNWAVGEMERRYKLMSKLGVRNLAGYNKKIDEAAAREEKIPNPFSLTPDAPEPLDRLPTIVIVIDELADLMMVVGKKVEELIARIAQKARAAGLHLVLATQRPSVDVITGLIKANVPTRIAFQVSSKIDSRTILDQQGAEALLGMGDMLYLAPGTGLPVRVHGAFVSDEEVHRVVEKLKESGEANYIEGILEGGLTDDAGGGDGFGGGAGIGGGGGEADPLYDQAVEVVLKNRRASISLVQRHLRIGYNRAARLLEDMEKAGLVSAMSGNGNRDILAQGGGAAARDDD